MTETDPTRRRRAPLVGAGAAPSTSHRPGPSGGPGASPAADVALLVDLDRYPIDDLAHPVTAALVAGGADAMATTGAFELTAFLSPTGVAACVADAIALEPFAHRSHGTTTPYLEQPDRADWPDGHPRVRRNPFSLGAVAYDLFPASSPVRAIYEWPALLRFVAAVLGRDELFRYADPLGALNLAVMADGDELGWHFDQTDFVVSLALRSAEVGGELEVVPATRRADDERYDHVAASLDGDVVPEVLPNVAGTLLLFAGRGSLHRVSPIAGPTTRLMALFGYDDRPDTRSSETLQRSRYGRTA